MEENLVEIKITIPFWYRFFINFMPDFWLDFPREKKGNWTTSVLVTHKCLLDNVYESRKKKGNYKSLQKAYLKARLRAMWAGFWYSKKDIEIMWQVLALNEYEIKQ